MEAQQNRTRGLVAVLAGAGGVFSAPMRYSESMEAVALTAGTAGSCGFGGMPGINLDELAIEMIDGNYRDAKCGRRPVGRMPAEAR